MDNYTYLIIGSSMTADAAVRGIREFDISNSIGIIGQEKYMPYNRPPLSKGLWFGKPLESIWRKTEQEKVSFHLGKRVVSINPDKHTVIDNENNTYGYTKLLLATGGTARLLDCKDEGIIYFRTLNDYYLLRSLYERGNEFVVIGSGYIGTEIAAALAMNGKKVTLIFQEPSIGATKYPKAFSLFLNAYFTEKGVQLLPQETVTSVLKKDKGYRVQTSGQKTLYADGVVAGIGISPNTELAEALHLSVDNGIVVDRYLQTTNPDIFAAGDVANFYNPLLEKRLRIEHEDAANTMGKVAGGNMTGTIQEYTHLPNFYSDLFELGYEAVGELSSHMEIIEDWHDLYRKGILYYLRNGMVRGAIAWGIWDQMDKIRQLIASKEKVTADTLGSVRYPI